MNGKKLGFLLLFAEDLKNIGSIADQEKDVSFLKKGHVFFLISNQPIVPGPHIVTFAVLCPLTHGLKLIFFFQKVQGEQISCKNENRINLLRMI